VRAECRNVQARHQRRVPKTGSVWSGS
jgi:hypothetical protein